MKLYLGLEYRQRNLNDNNRPDDDFGIQQGVETCMTRSNEMMSTYRMTFVEPSGEEHEVEFMEDDTILDVALDNDIESRARAEESAHVLHATLY